MNYLLRFYYRDKEPEANEENYFELFFNDIKTALSRLYEDTTGFGDIINKIDLFYIGFGYLEAQMTICLFGNGLIKIEDHRSLL